MKKKYIITFMILFLIFAVIFDLKQLDKKNSAAQKVNITTLFGMDTFIDIKLYGEDNVDSAIDEISTQLSEFEKKMSMHIADGEIGNVNLSSGTDYVKVSKQTIDIITKAKKYSELSNGVFDITIAPVSNLWKQNGENSNIPTKSEIDSKLPLVNYNDILIDYDNSAIMLKTKDQSIDLGAIAKGEFANIAFDILDKHGVENGYLSIGGNMVVIGTKPDGADFKFGIRDPNGSQDEYIGSVSLRGKTMATAGGYERYFEKDEKKYIHIINPHTGYPAESDLLSVSVISKDGTLADYLSTTLFIMGKDILLENINNPLFDIVAVDNENNIYISNDLKDIFEENKTSTPYKYNYIVE